jgi:hypothetical protein
MITITCTIQLESTDLTDLIDNANWSRLFATLALTTPTTPTTPSAPVRSLPAFAQRRQFVRSPREATELPTSNETNVPVPEPSADGETLKIEAVPPAKQADTVSTETKRNNRPQTPLAFTEFDKLARAELKRLSMDGRIPGHKLWESERNPLLPTLGGVLQRYKCATLAELAGLVGLEPPLRGNHAPLGRETATIE